MRIFLTGSVLAVVFAQRSSRLSENGQKYILVSLAILFPFSEIVKQLLLFVSNGFSYDWWYFPFQLCSMPMYLLPLYCLLPKKYRRIRIVLVDFLVDFGLLGGIFAFADQSGMHYDLPVLIMHSYLWHFLMIFLGLFLILTQKNSSCLKDFILPCALFLLLAGIATYLNIMIHTRGFINMFYISPYFSMGQVVFRDITRFTGQTAGHLIYIGAEILGACLIHLCSGKLGHD